MTAVGNDDVERPVAVDISQAHGGSQFAAPAQRPGRPERPLLLRGQRAADKGNRREADSRKQPDSGSEAAGGKQAARRHNAQGHG